MRPTVICATEETTAEAVVPAAGELAGALGARLVLVHLRRDPGPFNSRPDLERARHKSNRRGRDFLRRARELLPGDLETEERVEFGVAADELAVIAHEEEAALIAVGSRKRGSIAAALTGSVSRTLAREAPCPVLIVGAPAAARLGERPAGVQSPSTVIAGIDGSDRSLKAAVFAGELADRLGDRLLLVHAHEDASTTPAVVGRAGAGISTPPVLTDALARAGDDAALVIEDGPPASMLEGVSAREDARLIVIGAGSSGGLRSVLAGSVAEQLPSLAPCPVIVVPEQASATLDTAPPGEGLQRAA